MVGWSRSQADFARGRQALLDKELEGLPEAAAAAVKAMFTEFEKSIAGAEGKAARRETMTFEELAADMGYEMPKREEKVRRPGGRSSGNMQAQSEM